MANRPFSTFLAVLGGPQFTGQQRDAAVQKRDLLPQSVVLVDQVPRRGKCDSLVALELHIERGRHVPAYKWLSS